MTVVADGAVTEFDAFDVDVVDATGAGDSFVAGLIDRWIAGSDSGDDPRRERAGVADGVRFAAAVAAINCTSRFAQTGLPTRDDVEAFLAERDSERGSRAVVTPSHRITFTDALLHSPTPYLSLTDALPYPHRRLTGPRPPARRAPPPGRRRRGGRLAALLERGADDRAVGGDASTSPTVSSRTPLPTRTGVSSPCASRSATTDSIRGALGSIASPGPASGGDHGVCEPAFGGVGERRLRGVPFGRERRGVFHVGVGEDADIDPESVAESERLVGLPLHDTLVSDPGTGVDVYPDVVGVDRSGDRQGPLPRRCGGR